MFPSLRALLAGLIDYAGLFPPANLPLAEAILNYARYRQSLDAWMLGRFICPAGRLGDLAPHAGLFEPGKPFAFSALGRGGNSSAELIANLTADLADIATFRERHGAQVRVDVLEVRLPPGLEAELQGVASVLRQPADPSPQVFFEMSFGGDGRFPIHFRLAWLRQHAGGQRFGLKLRCGGLEASSFPPAEQIALALRAALDAGVPLKATAGLHHPFPRFDENVQAVMHGFINLFVAGVLARARGLGEEQIRAILEDAEPAHFTFDEEGVSWQGLRASTAEIIAARQESVLSFGSCSFDEPRDDLRALGWL